MSKASQTKGSKYCFLSNTLIEEIRPGVVVFYSGTYVIDVLWTLYNSMVACSYKASVIFTNVSDDF